MLSFEFLLRLSAILKLDFLKRPGKSGSARPPRGMKLGNRGVCQKRFDYILEIISLSYCNTELN